MGGRPGRPPNNRNHDQQINKGDDTAGPLGVMQTLPCRVNPSDRTGRACATYRRNV